MKRILGIGNALVDILILIDDDGILDAFDLPKGSMQLVDIKKSEQIQVNTKNFIQTRSSGGSVANTIHGLAMLGIDAGYIGSTGRDDTGDFFENDLKAAGVKTYLTRRNSVTGTALTLISPDSERTFATHLGAAVELHPDDLDPAWFREHDILYVEGYLITDAALVEKACLLARENNMTIALDLASYNVVEAYRDSFKKIADRYVDILFANEMEAEAFTGVPSIRALDLMGNSVELAVIKAGANGSWLRKGKKTIKIDATPVRCDDTTGAGDLYASGFLYGYATGMDLEKCGLIGSMMAEKVIGITGARMGKTEFTEIIKNIGKIVQGH